MNKPKFVVISGKKQSGKDTLAKMISEELSRKELSSKIISFADPLKKMCHIVFGIPMELMYGSDEDKETLTTVQWDGLPRNVRNKYHPLQGHYRTGSMTVREVLQVIGTDIFRERIYKDVWAAAPFKAQHDEDFVLIPDCRFPNEVQYAGKHGTLVRVKRDTGVVDKHASETALDNTPDTVFNYTYTNAGTLDDLRRFAHEISSYISG